MSLDCYHTTTLNGKTRFPIPPERPWRQWVLLVVLMALLFGCATPAAPPATDSIIVLWHSLSGTEAQTLQNLGDAFNAAHPEGPTLIVDYQRQIQEKLTHLPPAQRPALAVIDAHELVTYSEAGMIFSPRLASEAIEDLLPPALALYSHEGRLRGIPLGLVTHVLYYNSDWVRDLVYDSAGADLALLRNTACNAANLEAGQVGLGIAARPDSALALLAAGDAFATRSGVVLRGTESVAVAQTLQTLLNDECALIFNSSALAVEPFSRGSVAFVVGSTLERVFIEEAVAGRDNFSLGIAPLPGPRGPGVGLWRGPGLVLLSSEGPERQAAEAVMGWLLGAEAQALWDAETYYLPTRVSLVEARLSAAEEGGSEAQLLRLALRTVDEAPWDLFGAVIEETACRAALVRGLTRLKGAEPAEVVLAEMERTCNTGGQP